MKQYLELIQRVLDTGEWTFNERTQKRTLMVPGAMMTYDLREGYPAVTTKRLAFKSVVGELCAFLRASRSAADFRELGSKVWDQNANENAQWLANPFRKGVDDLGDVYGVQWREWPAYKLVRTEEQFEHAKANGWRLTAFNTSRDCGTLMTKAIDQLGDCVRTIMTNPSDRRILFHGWNPAVLDEIALPACHLLYQFLPNSNTGLLHMNMYQRSCDNFLGTPFNIAQAAALQSLVARLTGYKAALLNIFHGDSHLYEDHIEQAKLQLTREPFPIPGLFIKDRVPKALTDPEEAVKWLKLVEPSDFILKEYQHHEAIAAPMAV